MEPGRSNRPSGVSQRAEMLGRQKPADERQTFSLAVVQKIRACTGRGREPQAQGLHEQPDDADTSPYVCGWSVIPVV